MKTNTQRQLIQLTAAALCVAYCTASIARIEPKAEAEALWTIGTPLRGADLPDNTPDLADARIASYPLQLHREWFHDPLIRQGGEPRFRAVGGIPALAGRTVPIQLPESRKTHHLEIQTVHEELPGIITYSGLVDGDIAALFTLTFNEGELLGKIHHTDRTYLITADRGGDSYIMHEIDKRRLPPPNPPGHEHRHQHSSSGDHQLMSNPSCGSYTPNNDNGNVRILFLYTPNAAAKAPSGITSLVNQIVAEHNQSAFNSEVEAKNYISVAGIQVVNDEFDGMCREDIFLDMVAGSGVFSSLASSIAQTNSDIAFLILDEDPDAYDGPWGDCFPPPLGRIGGAATRFNHTQPYALSTVTYALGDLTAPHELGHAMGGQHTVESQASLLPGAPDCARGYIVQSGQSQTMMGGYDHATHCPFDPLPGPQSCIRLPLWSNPGKSYSGSPTGHAQTAFMARALNMTMTEVAEWNDSYPTPRPSAPAAPTVQSQFCFGLNIVQWPTVSGVDHFQLFSSLSSSPGDWSLVYHGSGTSSGVSVPSGEAMNLRLRGCNGNGCSNYSALAFAQYYPDCM